MYILTAPIITTMTLSLCLNLNQILLCMNNCFTVGWAGSHGALGHGVLVDASAPQKVCTLSNERIVCLKMAASTCTSCKIISFVTPITWHNCKLPYFGCAAIIQVDAAAGDHYTAAVTSNGVHKPAQFISTHPCMRHLCGYGY